MPVSTKPPPSHTINKYATFTATNIAGLSSAFILPAFTANFLYSSAVSSKRFVSCSCRENALTTRTPDKFSLVMREIPSSDLCCFLNSFTVTRIIGYITATIAAIAPRNISDSRAEIVNAMTVAPITKNGALTTNLISIATAVCTWLTSLEMRVTSAAVPSLSSSLYDSVLMCLYRSSRSRVPTPCEATLAIYWQISANVSPHTASATNIMPCFQI